MQWREKACPNPFFLFCGTDQFSPNLYFSEGQKWLCEPALKRTPAASRGGFQLLSAGEFDVNVGFVGSFVKLNLHPGFYQCLAVSPMTNYLMNCVLCNANSTMLPKSPKKEPNRQSLEYKHQQTIFPVVVQTQIRGYASLLQ